MAPKYETVPKVMPPKDIALKHAELKDAFPPKGDK